MKGRGCLPGGLLCGVLGPASVSRPWYFGTFQAAALELSTPALPGEVWGVGTCGGWGRVRFLTFSKALFS